MATKLESVTGTAPSHWASYLINGDASGFDYYVTPSDPDAATREIAQADAFAAWLCGPTGHIVSCEDAGFLALKHESGQVHIYETKITRSAHFGSDGERL